MKDTLKAAWNHGGSMFATFWIVIALYALGGYLVWAFLQLDAQFSRPLAGDVIPANVTQQIAWGTRAFSVIAGSMAIYFHVKDMPAWRRIFSILTGVAAIILLLHAYGISAKIMQGQFNADAAISDVAEVNTGAIEQQIADLQQERTDLRSDTQVTLDTYQRAIDNITSDGLDNDDQAEVYAVKQQEALEARDERLGEIRGEIASLRTENRTVSATATQETAESDSFNPLFVFGARLSTWEWNPAVDPSNVHKFAWGVAFFTLFFGFGEILMMVAFTGGYAALKVVSEREKRSAAAKKGHETRKAKEAEISEPLKIEDNEFWLTRIPKALNTGLKRRTIKGMCQTYFGTIEPGALREHLYRQIDKRIELSGTYRNSKGDMVPYSKAIERGLLSADRPTFLMQEHIDFIFSEGEYAPKPKPNGQDHDESLSLAKRSENDESGSGQPVA
jgi:hypothetical protein